MVVLLILHHIGSFINPAENRLSQTILCEESDPNPKQKPAGRMVKMINITVGAVMGRQQLQDFSYALPVVTKTRLTPSLITASLEPFLYLSLIVWVNLLTKE